jgi:gliding motility-associated-like protein
VTVNNLPAKPVILTSGPVTFCEGGSVTLTSSSATSYLWSTGAVTAGINISESGNYNVSVTDLNGCQSQASPVTVVTVNPLPVTPVITAGSPVTFCEGGNVSLASTEGTSYLWSTGDSLKSINASLSGSYTVRVTDSKGCQSQESAVTVIIVNPIPSIPLISANSPTTFCDGGSVTLSSSSAADYLWSNGANTSSIYCNKSGNYTVKVANSNGCHSQNSLTTVVTVYEIPVAIAGPDQELTYITETQMTAESTSALTGQWSLISGSGLIADIHSPTTKISKLATGKNKFMWKVINGTCESVDEISINILDLFIPSVITPDGDGKNDYFRINEMPGKVELIIFNRWGNVEYSNKNYLNDWDGRNTSGMEVPADTYFYILKFDKYLTRKGSLLIKR